MQKFYLRQLFVAIATLLCSVAASAHDFEVDGIYYNITSTSNYTVEVTFKGSSPDYYLNEYTGSVVIPSTVSYNGNKYSVTSIGAFAFDRCYKLEIVKISNSVTNIGVFAFYGCDGLTSITIPNSVTSIEEPAFDRCTALNTLIYHSTCSIPSKVFTRCDNLSNIVYTSQVPPTSLILATNTYVPNKEVYAKSTVSAGSGNFIEHVSFQGANATYGETPKTEFINNLEKFGYAATATVPSISTTYAGTHTIDIPFTFTKGNNHFDVNIPYKYIIDKAPLVVKADSSSRLYGEENPSFTITYSGFVNGEDASVLTNKGTATTSATARSDVGIYNIVVSGATADNYKMQYEKGSLTVNKALLTVAVNNATKVYGDNNPKFTLEYSGLKNKETSPQMVSAFNIATNATKTSNVGEYDISVSGGEAKNYEIINYTNGKLTVTKAPLTVTANNATKTYGDGNPSFDFSCVGLKNDDTASTIFSKNPILKCSATNYSDTGNYDIIVSGGEAYNYNVTNYANGTLSVTKAPLTISANNCTRIYGDENPAFEYNCIGLRNSDNPNEIFETKPQTICSATAKSAVGEYDINIIGGAAKNYNIVNNEKGVLTIEKAQLTAIVKNLSRVYGDENPEWILSYYGLKNGETSPEMLTAFNITTDATKLSNVGEYDIALSGGEAKNYEIVNYTNGKLAVTKAPLTVTAKNFTKIYGSINPEFKYSYNGAKNNDSEGAIFETLPTISCVADETSNVGVYEIEIGDASSNNYEISYKSGILSVNKREITVSTKNYTRIYGAENPNFEILYNGFVNNEDESVLLIKPKAKTNADKDSDVGTYDITIEGGDDDNYSFAYSCGALTIEKANQTITWEQEFDDLVVGSQIELTAKASSGLDIEYIIPDNNFLSVYTIGGSTYLDCYDAGEIVIRATQNGNKNYNAAVRVSKVIKIVPTGINSASADAMVKIDGNYITVSSANNCMVAVYTVNGALVEKIDSYAGEEISLDKGVYIVRVGNKTIKVNI